MQRGPLALGYYPRLHTAKPCFCGIQCTDVQQQEKELSEGKGGVQEHPCPGGPAQASLGCPRVEREQVKDERCGLRTQTLAAGPGLGKNGWAELHRL